MLSCSNVYMLLHDHNHVFWITWSADRLWHDIHLSHLAVLLCSIEALGILVSWFVVLLTISQTLEVLHTCLCVHITR